MPAGYAGTFDSADVSAWRPTTFKLYSMPAGYAGTFNSADVSAWQPAVFYLYSMPAGYAGTFDSADVSGWGGGYVWVKNMPVATFTIIFTAGGLAGWTAPINIDFRGNSLNQGQVDQILADFWAGYPAKTVLGGVLIVTGNAAPSGTFQAANPPTTGKEYAYELLNDSQNINPTKKWTQVSFT